MKIIKIDWECNAEDFWAEASRYLTPEHVEAFGELQRSHQIQFAIDAEADAFLRALAAVPGFDCQPVLVQ